MKPIKVLEQEKRRLQKKLEEHRGNHRDTGLDRYSNLVWKYEDEILVIDRAIASLKEFRLVEVRVDALVTDIEKIMDRVQREHPDNEGLMVAQSRVTARLDKWRASKR